MKRTIDKTTRNVSIVIVAALLLGGGYLIFRAAIKDKLPVNAELNAPNDADHNRATNSIEQPKENPVDMTSLASVQIEIKDYKYSVPNIKIRKGTTVTWTNRDDIKHNVMKEHEDSDAAHDAPTLDQVKPDVFAGQLLAKGESYSFTFNETSTDPYHCSPHPYMKGSVTIVD